MKVGILALQGAVQPHEEKLKELGITPIQVRYPEQLIGLAGMILPGGESTTMVHLLKLSQLWFPLKEFAKTQPTWGVCAGAILLAETITHSTQDSLSSMEITVERNSYGRQGKSFIDTLVATEEWRDPASLEGVFIRAPRIQSYSSKVKVLLKHGNDAVMVQQGRCLASTFHPELTSLTLVHQYFLSQC